MINSPWLAFGITLIICIIWMRLINFLAARNVFTSNTSRKLIHIGTGPIFVLCWLLFPDQPISKYLAALVPFLIVVQVLLVGAGLMKDRTSVKAMARSGLNRELLRGPLFYGIVFVLLTIFFWRTAYAIIPLMILCGGDGAADLIGSRYPSMRLPWSKRKTLLGSIAMFLGGAILSIVIILLVRAIMIGAFSTSAYLLPILLVSLLATIVESVSPSDYDNLTVPAVALIASLLIL